MARRAEDLPSGSVVIANGDDLSPEAFRAMLDELAAGPEPVIESLHAGELLADVIRHRTVLSRSLADTAATATMERLGRWHLRQALIPPLLPTAWSFRRNTTMADAIYVALTVALGGQFLCYDHKLLDGPTFPTEIAVLRLDVT